MKKIIIAIIVIVLIGWVMYEVKDGNEDAPVNGTAFSGVVTAIDLEQAMVDGPYVVTIKDENAREQVIHIPSMGIRLCAAADAISHPSEMKVGDTVEVRGAITADGTIVPCESADHYFRSAKK